MSGSEKKNKPHEADPMIIQVKQGLLQGTTCTSVYHTLYIYFLNIPYAAPPIGQLRFMDPQPPGCWKGIRDKNQNENMCCMQMRSKIDSYNFIGTEDCLYLNVYKRCFIPDALHPLAVMVWIHGGNFLTGSGNFNDVKPDYLMEQNIVLVSINYRLGALGFLNLGHKTASGNQGLKDQVAALKWVKENIAAFGGDPNNITIFGSGMGAVCVHLLMLSPLSKGLFEKAILQSGVAIVNWTLLQDKVDTNSRKLAISLGCQSKDPEEIATFLRKIPAADIVKMQMQILSPQEIGINKPVFVPTIDKYAECPFLPCSYDELLDNGNDIPVILGHNYQEYKHLFINITKFNRNYLRDEVTYWLRKYLESRERIYGERNQQRKIQESQEKILITAKLKHEHLIQPMSDIFFDYPIQQYTNIRLKKKAQPTYFYKFYYTGEQNIVLRNSFWYTCDLHGNSHGDELGYLHYMPKYLKKTEVEAPKPGSDDYFMIQFFTTMWANFATTGKPTFSCSKCETYNFTKYKFPEWTPVTIDNFCNLEISNDIECIGMVNIREERRELH